MKSEWNFALFVFLTTAGATSGVAETAPAEKPDF
jgi:hypothetical protein